MTRPLIRFLAAAVAVALAVAGCGGSSGGSDDAETGGLTIATTVAPITSIVSSIVGDRATIVGIVPEGTNSHTYEPPPSVAQTLATADVIFLNGLQLEEPVRLLAESAAPAEATMVALGDATITEDEYRYDFSFPESGGSPNPHLWTDPTLVAVYAQLIADTMTEVDPDGAEMYASNLDAFLGLVDRFDEASREAFSTIPEAQRKLVTYHDAYAYFADTYGWTVVGAVQPADFGEPTPGEVIDLIEQIEAEGVTAVFGSEVFPSPVLEQIANETSATYVDELRDDDLPGTPGDPEHSWLGLMRSNFITMTEALGGDAASLIGFELAATNDEATYPQ